MQHSKTHSVIGARKWEQLINLSEIKKKKNIARMWKNMAPQLKWALSDYESNKRKKKKK